MAASANLIGQQFGRLTVTGLVEHTPSGKIWEVRCICGNVRRARTGKLRNGEHVSCGCQRIERLRQHHVDCRIHIIDGHKVCGRCRRNLPISSFCKSKRSRCGLFSRCTDCVLASSYRAVLSISHDAADALVLARKTATCGACNTDVGVCMDHDHATRRFRGWLCGDCNRALGLLRDDPARIERLAAYVVTHINTPLSEAETQGPIPGRKSWRKPRARYHVQKLDHKEHGG
jgi:hypothetical protein